MDRKPASAERTTGGPHGDRSRAGYGSLGGIAGAVGGAAIGAVFGPIGLLVGGAAGSLAGIAAGQLAGEALDPDCEREFWRGRFRDRPYARPEFDYERDYLPAYRYGAESRRHLSGRTWDATLESELKSGWAAARSGSRLDWEDARDAARDGWIRADRTYTAYIDTDSFFTSQWRDAGYRGEFDFDDFRPAYRYGTYARRAYPNRRWDDALERELAAGWSTARGTSTLDWNKARSAVREAWLRLERDAEADLHRRH